MGCTESNNAVEPRAKHIAPVSPKIVKHPSNQPTKIQPPQKPEKPAEPLLIESNDSDDWSSLPPPPVPDKKQVTNVKKEIKSISKSSLSSSDHKLSNKSKSFEKNVFQKEQVKEMESSAYNDSKTSDSKVNLEKSFSQVSIENKSGNHEIVVYELNVTRLQINNDENKGYVEEKECHEENREDKERGNKIIVLEQILQKDNDDEDSKATDVKEKIEEKEVTKTTTECSSSAGSVASSKTRNQNKYHTVGLANIINMIKSVTENEITLNSDSKQRSHSNLSKNGSKETEVTIINVKRKGKSDEENDD